MQSISFISVSIGQESIDINTNEIALKMCSNMGPTEISVYECRNMNQTMNPSGIKRNSAL